MIVEFTYVGDKNIIKKGQKFLEILKKFLLKKI